MSEYKIVSNKYGKYCVPVFSDHTPPIVETVSSGLVHEPNTVRFIEQNYQTGDIIHAGAYFGDFLPFLSQTCREGFIIRAFEPNPSNYYYARKTLELNDINNVKLTNVALSNKNTILPITTIDEHGKSKEGGSHVSDDEEEGTVYVSAKKIDDIVDHNNVGLIHLDVEGHEKKALKGGLKTIQDSKPMLILEDLDNTILKDKWFASTIINIGYQKVEDIGLNTVFAHKKS